MIRLRIETHPDRLPVHNNAEELILKPWHGEVDPPSACALIRSPKPNLLRITLQQGLDLVVRRDDVIAWTSADHVTYSIEEAAQLDSVLDGLQREELEVIAQATRQDPRTLCTLIEDQLRRRDKAHK